MNIEDERRVRQIIGCVGECISVVIFCIMVFPLLPIIFEFWESVFISLRWFGY